MASIATFKAGLNLIDFSKSCLYFECRVATTGELVKLGIQNSRHACRKGGVDMDDVYTAQDELRLEFVLQKYKKANAFQNPVLLSNGISETKHSGNQNQIRFNSSSINSFIFCCNTSVCSPMYLESTRFAGGSR